MLNIKPLLFWFFFQFLILIVIFSIYSDTKIPHCGYNLLPATMIWANLDLHYMSMLSHKLQPFWPKSDKKAYLKFQLRLAKILPIWMVDVSMNLIKNFLIVVCE